MDSIDFDSLTVVEIKQAARKLDLDPRLIHRIEKEIKKAKTARPPGRLIDGHSTRELGMGYPLSVDAKICTECHGNGFTLEQMICGSIPCNLCHGAGQTRLSRRKCVECNSDTRPMCSNCSGSGEETFVTFSMAPRTCDECSGSGFTTPARDSPAAYMIRCMTCIGIGEVMPVRRRGKIEARRDARLPTGNRSTGVPIRNKGVG